MLAACGPEPATPSALPTRDHPRKPLPVVGAYYYPWYTPPRWKDQPTADTPKLGTYSSGDRKTAAQHIAWARQADIDFFIVSWTAPGTVENDNLKRTLAPELEKAHYRFAVLYETQLALGLPAARPIDLGHTLPNATTAGATLIEHFDYLAQVYFPRKSYLRIEGRPVVVIYVARDLVNAGPCLKALRQRLGKHGIDPFLIADVVYWAPPETLDWGLLKEHFQAVTAYNMYAPAKANRGDFLDAVREQFGAAERAASASGLHLIPNVMPGYDDTRLRGPGRPVVDRLGGEFYRKGWAMASEFAGPQQPFVFVTSFNEWHEGTELEPSAEHGETYLTLTREQASQLRARLDSPTQKP